MANGWTGGQYSVLRAMVGLYVSIQFLRAVPRATLLLSSNSISAAALTFPGSLWLPNVLAVWHAPGLLTAMLLLATGVSVLFAVGFRDRLLAVIVLLPLPELLPSQSALSVGSVLLMQVCFTPLALLRRVRPWLLYRPHTLSTLPQANRYLPTSAAIPSGTF